MSAPRATEQDVQLDVGSLTLDGNLAVPGETRGLVLFAHGSGSSRLSPRNRFVAQRLQHAGIATLLFDLLTSKEEQEEAETGHLRFDIRLLADRLLHALDWTWQQPNLRDLPVGLFGASTGAAAALVAAGERPGRVLGVVSRGGRPDLAGDALYHVRAATLLIVGGRDNVVLDLNREAFDRLTVEQKELIIIPGATHLFPEPGALEAVAELAANWFLRHLLPAIVPAV